MNHAGPNVVLPLLMIWVSYEILLWTIRVIILLIWFAGKVFRRN